MRRILPVVVFIGLVAAAGCGGNSASSTRTVEGPLTEDQKKALREEDKRIEAEERGPVKAPSKKR
jgi:hypothetical protein